MNAIEFQGRAAMEQGYLYEDIEELKTPVGSFTIKSLRGKIKFSVKKNILNLACRVTDENDNEIGKIQTDTNYSILIKTDQLSVGVDYEIVFSCGKWEYCDSDEHTTCYDTIIKDWVVGIGAYDPNDQEKEDQIWKQAKEKRLLDKGYVQELEKYDESRLQDIRLRYLKS